MSDQVALGGFFFRAAVSMLLHIWDGDPALHLSSPCGVGGQCSTLAKT